QWDLALIDVALYRPLGNAPGKYVIVPHLRNVVKSELRQVVRIVVEGESPSARVEVKRIEGDDVTPARQKWDESGFSRISTPRTSRPPFATWRHDCAILPCVSLIPLSSCGAQEKREAWYLSGVTRGSSRCTVQERSNSVRRSSAQPWARNWATSIAVAWERVI